MSNSNVPECAICHRPIDCYDAAIFKKWCKTTTSRDAVRKQGNEVPYSMREKEITNEKFYGFLYEKESKNGHVYDSEWKTLEEYLFEKFDKENEDRCSMIETDFGKFHVCPACKAIISLLALKIIR